MTISVALPLAGDGRLTQIFAPLTVDFSTPEPPTMVSKGNGENDEGKPLSLSETVDNLSRNTCPPILHNEPKHRIKNRPPDENCTFIDGARGEGRGTGNGSAVKGKQDKQNQQACCFVNLRWVTWQSVNAEG